MEVFSQGVTPQREKIVVCCFCYRPLFCRRIRLSLIFTRFARQIHQIMSQVLSAPPSDSSHYLRYSLRSPVRFIRLSLIFTRFARQIHQILSQVLSTPPSDSSHYLRYSLRSPVRVIRLCLKFLPLAR
jgi:TnpA family transposase